MKFAALVLLTVLWAVPVQAQAICETNCELSQGVAFVAFTEVDATVTSYVLYVNGARSSIAARIVGGMVEFVFPSGLTRGTYGFLIVATDAAGEAWRTEVNTLTVKPGRRTVKFR